MMDVPALDFPGFRVPQPDRITAGRGQQLAVRREVERSMACVWPDKVAFRRLVARS